MYHRLTRSLLLAAPMLSCGGPQLTATTARTFQGEVTEASCNVPPSGWPASNTPYIDMQLRCTCNTSAPLHVGIVAPAESKTPMQAHSVTLPKDYTVSVKTQPFNIPNGDGSEVVVLISATCDDQSTVQTSVGCKFKKP